MTYFKNKCEVSICTYMSKTWQCLVHSELCM